jgi:hypothetical protein
MRVQEQVEMEKMEKLREMIEGSPLTQKIKEEKAAEILAKRKETRQKVDQLQVHLESLPSADEAVAEFKAELSILQDREQLLKQKINEKDLALRSEKFEIENEKGRLETTLWETSDPLINGAITFFQNRREVLFHKSIDRQTYVEEKNLINWTKKLISFSNARSIAAALAYCLACIHALEDMRFEPVLDASRIESMKRGIPNTDEMTGVSGEKPMEKINTDPRSLLESDSQITWELSKLNEKFQKWLRK